MATRTVRLDPEAEEALQEVRDATGLPISAVLKEGLRALRARVRNGEGPPPYAVYRELDLGPGGYASAPSTDSRRAVRRAIRKKLGRLR